MLYEVVHAVVPPVAKLYWRPRIEGLENIPSSGPVIVASNHVSFADSMVIPFFVPRKVVFLAKEDYFTGTGVKGALVRGWFEGIGMVPGRPRRHQGGAGLAATSRWTCSAAARRSGSTPRAPARVTAGSTVAGPGSRTWRSRPARPSYPSGLIGTENIQPVGTTFPRRAAVTVRFGKPLQLPATRTTGCRPAGPGAR